MSYFFAFILVLPLLLLIFPSIRKCAQKNKIPIELLSSYVTIIGIVSLFTAIFSYCDYKNTQKENNELLMENLEREIQYNQKLSLSINDKFKFLLTSVAMPVDKFQFYFMDLSKNFFKYEKIQRHLVIATIRDMKTINDVMDNIADLDTNIYSAHYMLVAMSNRTSKELDRLYSNYKNDRKKNMESMGNINNIVGKELDSLNEEMKIRRPEF